MRKSIFHFAFCVAALPLIMSYGCGKDEQVKTPQQETLEWLRKMPPKMNPTSAPPERLIYKSFDEWGEAGLQIPNVQRELESLYVSSQTTSTFRYDILMAMGFVGDDETVTFLMPILDSTVDNEQRLYAAYALGSLRANEAVELLSHIALSTDNHDLMVTAACALGDIRDLRAKPVLEHILKKKTLKNLERRNIECGLQALERKSE